MHQHYYKDPNMKISRHLFPESITEAIDLLRKGKGKACLIAGGTDFSVEIREGSNDFEILIDTAKIPRLREIELRDNEFVLGSGVTMARVEENEAIQRGAGVLSQACGWVGGPQIRARATLGGNIVSAQPAADAALALFALDARLTIIGPEGKKTIQIEDAYRGVGESAINSRKEIITSIRFRKHTEDEASAFFRLMKRKALTLPMLNCAVVVRKIGMKFDRVAIALGPVAPIPLRMKRAEESLNGKPITRDLIIEAAQISSEDASPRDSVFRGSGSYRKAMTRVIVTDAIKTALSQLNVEID